MNHKIKLNFANLKGVGLKDCTDSEGNKKQCLIMPIEENKIFIGNKGIYLDLIAFEVKEPKFGNTHIVRTVKSNENEESALIGNMSTFETRKLNNLSTYNDNSSSATEGTQESSSMANTLKNDFHEPTYEPKYEKPKKDPLDEELPF